MKTQPASSQFHIHPSYITRLIMTSPMFAPFPSFLTPILQVMVLTSHFPYIPRSPSHKNPDLSINFSHGSHRNFPHTSQVSTPPSHASQSRFRPPRWASSPPSRGRSPRARPRSPPDGRSARCPRDLPGDTPGRFHNDLRATSGMEKAEEHGDFTRKP